MTNKEKLVKEFNKIKALGFVKSRRRHDTGIGKTFEDYLGVDENNKKDPDFEGFEVKSQRELTSSYLTLFTKSPSHPKGANGKLKDQFGKPDVKFPQFNSLHTSIFGNKFNTYNDKFSFKLLVNHKSEKIELLAKNLKTKKKIATNTFWTFEDLKKCIDHKLRSLFVVAKTKKNHKSEYFHYTSADIYYNLMFDKFLIALESGQIMFDIRIGVYKSGKQIGKPHDHGSGFRIKRANLIDLFEEIITV